jgi:hypothetical protein
MLHLDELHRHMFMRKCSILDILIVVRDMFVTHHLLDQGNTGTSWIAVHPAAAVLVK